MKPAPLPFALLLTVGIAVSATRRADRLQFDPDPQATATVTFTSELRLHYERARTFIDGREEDVVAQVPQARDSFLRSRLRFAERIPQARDGRALQIDRRYLAWSQEDELGAILSHGGLRQLLVDRQLRFQSQGQGWERTLLPREESEEAPAATDPSRSELQRLAVELDFRALLPEGEAVRGDRWTAPPHLLGSLLAPGLSTESWSEPEPIIGPSPLEDDSMRSGLRAWLTRLQSEGPALQCSYLGRDTTGVRPLVQIEFTLEREDQFDADAPTRAAALRDIGEGQALFRRFEHQVVTKVEGRLHWDLDAGRFARLEARVSLRVSRSLDLTLDAGGQTSELGSLQVFRVELDASAVVE